MLECKNLHPFLTPEVQVSLANLCTELCLLRGVDLPQVFAGLVYVHHIMFMLKLPYVSWMFSLVPICL